LNNWTGRRLPPTCCSTQNWPRKIGADAWFNFRNCDRFDIEEQSFMLPGEEVLTVLTIPEDGLG
jgi:hypothetical protein